VVFETVIGDLRFVIGGWVRGKYPWALDRRVVDIPDERKVHRHAVPRLGEIAIFMAFLFTLLVFVNLSQYDTIANYFYFFYFIIAIQVVKLHNYLHDIPSAVSKTNRSA
jgi:UDP-N-acetylmuramyl pentapeptide phosphotransferase/UDP-N-acetylglucosamine-1-phosphate transferase